MLTGARESIGCKHSEPGVDHIQVPGEKWTANVSFCGKDRRTLFITASTGLYAVKMRVRSGATAK